MKRNDGGGEEMRGARISMSSDGAKERMPENLGALVGGRKKSMPARDFFTFAPEPPPPCEKMATLATFGPPPPCAKSRFWPLFDSAIFARSAPNP